MHLLADYSATCWDCSWKRCQRRRHVAAWHIGFAQKMLCFYIVLCCGMFETYSRQGGVEVCDKSAVQKLHTAWAHLQVKIVKTGMFGGLVRSKDVQKVYAAVMLGAFASQNHKVHAAVVPSTLASQHCKKTKVLRGFWMLRCWKGASVWVWSTFGSQNRNTKPLPQPCAVLLVSIYQYTCCTCLWFITHVRCNPYICLCSTVAFCCAKNHVPGNCFWVFE